MYYHVHCRSHYCLFRMPKPSLPPVITIVRWDGGVSARRAGAVPMDAASSDKGIPSKRFSISTFNANSPPACADIVFAIFSVLGSNKCAICCAEALVAIEIASSASGLGAKPGLVIGHESSGADSVCVALVVNVFVAFAMGSGS